MCGRFSLHANPEVIALAFKVGLVPDWKARYNITPSSKIIIVREGVQTPPTQPPM